MKIYKSYYIVRGKNTNKIFFDIIISFFGKKIAIVLLEIPSISNKFFITNETYIVFIIIYFFFFFFLFFSLFFFFFFVFFFFYKLNLFFFFNYLFFFFCFLFVAMIFFFVFVFVFVSLPSKKFIQVFADHILHPCLPRSL